MDDEHVHSRSFFTRTQLSGALDLVTMCICPVLFAKHTAYSHIQLIEVIYGELEPLHETTAANTWWESSSLVRVSE